MLEFPLQVIDDILRQYSVAHVILLLFVLTLLGAAAQKSLRLVGLVISVFGILLVLTPLQAHPTAFQYLGIGLVVVGPILFVTGSE